MHAQPVDERDSSWEDRSPRFRVYLFDRGRGGDDYAVTDTWDITDADVLDVLRWAQDRAGDDGLYAVALVRDEKQSRDDAVAERGLVWLVGMDWFDNVDGDPDGQRIKSGMLARCGRPAIAGDVL